MENKNKITLESWLFDIAENVCFFIWVWVLIKYNVLYLGDIVRSVFRALFYAWLTIIT